MRILLLTHAFNSLTQRLWLELAERGHELSVEFDINDAVTEEAVQLWQPDLVIAPFLKRAIPASVWQQQVCLIVHPGIVGDRGPSALDWAIQQGEPEWGVTLLQANATMDAGDIWAAETFPMRLAKKSSLYRQEVTEAAVRCVLAALERWPDYLSCTWRPKPVDYADPAVRGRERPPMRQPDRAIDWQRDDTLTVLRKINAADGSPGVADRLFGMPCTLFDARPAQHAGTAGELLGRCGTMLLRATADGAVWIGHARRAPASLKLPAAVCFVDEAAALPEVGEADDIRYEEHGLVGLLHFDFYNGAMSSGQCMRLRTAYLAALERPTRVLVLMGGEDFWSNGIHLNRIEAAESPADESMRNIQAMDDLALAILKTENKLTVAALRGNAGAGGCFLALAADEVWARRGVVLNPHYRNMGNLYGSEYWTYLLPKRVGPARAREIMRNRLPISAAAAVAEGLLDRCLGPEPSRLHAEVLQRAQALAESPDFADRLAGKCAVRACDEARKSLAAYRQEELAEMRRNFYGFDPSYHYARHNFVFKVPAAWTPRHLARHRELIRKSR